MHLSLSSLAFPHSKFPLQHEDEHKHLRSLIFTACTAPAMQIVDMSNTRGMRHKYFVSLRLPFFQRTTLACDVGYIQSCDEACC